MFAVGAMCLLMYQFKSQTMNPRYIGLSKAYSLPGLDPWLPEELRPRPGIRQRPLRRVPGLSARFRGRKNNQYIGVVVRKSI